MSNPIHSFDEVCGKLNEFCEENALHMQINKDKYPMTFEFSRQELPLLDGNDNDVLIRFRFEEEMFIEMDNARKISIHEAVFNKIRTMSKEAHRLYMLYAFYLSNRYYGMAFEPMWTTGDGSVVGILKRGYVPKDAKPASADPVNPYADGLIPA